MSIDKIVVDTLTFCNDEDVDEFGKELIDIYCRAGCGGDEYLGSFTQQQWQSVQGLFTKSLDK